MDVVGSSHFPRSEAPGAGSFQNGDCHPGGERLVTCDLIGN